MQNPPIQPIKKLLFLTTLASLTSPALAYVDTAPALPQIVTESQTICLVQVTTLDRDNHTLTLKPLRALKGDLPADLIQHQLTSATSTSIPTAISQWAAPNATAVLFNSRTTTLVCMGNSWYSASLTSSIWKLGKDRPDLPLAYSGTVSRLADAAKNLANGKDAIVTVVSYGADDAGTAFDLAFNRTNLPGLARLDRVHLTPDMQGSIGRVSSIPGYILGAGPVDEDDLPALLQNLSSNDPPTRAEAAHDLATLGKKAKSAITPLTALLKDPQPTVQLAAAAALLRISASTAPLDLLSQSLDSSDKFLQRDAAQSIGLAGPAAAPLTEKLAALLISTDPAIRQAALISIATLGPAAIKAAPAMRTLLDDPTTQCDAADALGRMGPAARPIPDILNKMLASSDTTAQWAAIRAISQIGGPESKSAVQFMINKLQSDSPITETYDIRIYLAMLAADAVDALPTLQTTNARNGKLSLATAWAIASDKSLPWTNEPALSNGPTGPKVIYDAYFNNLGQRLAPATKLFAQKLLEGTAGNVPVWGYRLLTCSPDDALNILTPHLADNTQQMRERAIVGLGYMGPAAQPAKAQLNSTLTTATDDREKRLIQWALRQLDRDEE